MSNRVVRERPARGRLLKAAAELFYAQGMAATGIDAITERAGVARKSLYNNFSSKDDLVLAYIDHAEAADIDGFRGCGLLNAAAELPAGAPGRTAVREHKEQVESILGGALAEIVDPARAGGLAEQLSFLLEGAVTRAGLEGSAERLVRAREIAASVIDAQ